MSDMKADSPVVDVVLEGGETFMGCEIPGHLLTEKESCIQFYSAKEQIRVVPLHRVKWCVLRPRQDPPSDV